MSSNVDMSLDALIEKDRAQRQQSRRGGRGSRGRGRGGRGGRGRGASANRPRAYDSRRRTAPYNARGGNMSQYYQHDPRVMQAAAPVASATNVSRKILVENLDFGVTESDVQQLFSTVGPLVSYSLHYDRAGRSRGVAEVEYQRSADAAAAIQEYNGRYLDSKPMRISFVATAGAVARAARPVMPAQVYVPQQPMRRQPTQQPTRGRGGTRTARGGRANTAAAAKTKAGTKAKKEEPKPTKDSLDAQLELYQTGKVSVGSTDLDKQLEEYQKQAATDDNDASNQEEGETAGDNEEA